MGSFSSLLGAAVFWPGGGGVFAMATGLSAAFLGSPAGMLLPETTGEGDVPGDCADDDPVSWVKVSEENKKNHQLTTQN